MKRITCLAMAVLAAVFFSMLRTGAAAPNATSASADAPAKKLKVAVLTGGHGFDHKTFFAMFDGFGDIEYKEIALKKDASVFDDISQWPYDVIVLYNMTAQITDKQKANFLALLDKGVGVLAMHHNIAAWPQWEEYPKIIGARYYLKKTQVGDKTIASTYKEGVEYTIRVEEGAHPITKGLSDFKVHDEVYGQCGFEPDNKYLIGTDHKMSDKNLGWVRKVRNANVCYIMPGHGTTIFSNPTYLKLIHNAIFWAAGREVPAVAPTRTPAP